MIDLIPVQLTAPTPARPLLIVGPSLGTSCAALWGACARDLAAEFEVIGWDLPGHGSQLPADAAFLIADLAAAVARLADRVVTDRGRPGAAFAYAGVSVGGAVGLQLLLDHGRRVSAATLLASGPVIGSPDSWRERAELVRSAGTSTLVEPSRQRWFAPAFSDHDPDTAGTLLQSLRDADADSYAYVCDALAQFDLRSRLGEIPTPVTAVAGALDTVTPVASLQEVAEGVRDGRLVLVDGVAHLIPAEAPGRTAELIIASSGPDVRTYIAGLATRRAVLGDAHVDRAQAATTDLNRDFQELITRYAWGEIWTRPGLSRRERSLMTLTALVAGGHHDELAMHVRAARRIGLSPAEIAECLLQSAIYCGVPAANAAFRIAAAVLAEPPEPP